jgi:hypothetical protein
VTYETLWLAWVGLMALCIGLAFAVMRWHSRPAERALSFILGALFAQLLLLVVVGVPRFLAMAFTEGAGAVAEGIGFIAAYAVGAAGVAAVGIACARNPLIRPTWWFIGGAVASNVLAAARIVVDWATRGVSSDATGLLLNLVLGSALVLGYRWGLRPRRPRGNTQT